MHKILLENPKRNELRYPFYLILLGLSSIQVLGILFGDITQTIAKVGEDGSFYLQIAKNMALGYGPTFDRLSNTTGFHWGWLLFLTVTLKLTPSELLENSENLFRLSSIIYSILLTIATGIIFEILLNLKKIKSDLFITIGPIIFYIYLVNNKHWLMETHLVLLSLASLYFIISKNLIFHKENRKPPNYLNYSLLPASLIVVLSRTDLVIMLFLMAFIILLFARKNIKELAPIICHILIGASIGLAITICLNFIVDGRPFSISSLIKSGGSFNDLKWILFTIKRLIAYYPALTISIIPLGFIYLISIAIKYKSHNDNIDKILFSALLSSYILLVFHILKNHFVVGWYLSAVILTSFLCSIIIIDKYLSVASLKYLKLSTIESKHALLIIALCYAPLSIKNKLVMTDWSYSEFISLISKNVPRNEKVFMEDLSGKSALLSNRLFVSGDGLVNSHEYYEKYLILGKVGDYIIDKKIKFFLTSNLSCDSIPNTSTDPWMRNLMIYKNNNIKYYKVDINLDYLTNFPIPISELYFPEESIVYDHCAANGVRQLLFRVPLTLNKPNL